MVCLSLPEDGHKNGVPYLLSAPVHIPAYEHNLLPAGTGHSLSDKLLCLQLYSRIIKLTYTDSHKHLLQETILFHHSLRVNHRHHPVRNLSEEKREIAAYVSKALSFVRKMQKFLATPQVPPLISANNTTETATSLLQWTGNAIDLVELIYGIDEMGCINNGNMPLKQLAPLLYKIFGVESKDCYRFYTDIKRRKNESRTYFLDRMQEKLNERMLRDDELDRMRR